jgi:hypothetical protein
VNKVQEEEEEGEEGEEEEEEEALGDKSVEGGFHEIDFHVSGY